jgi:hypothetical protein
VLYTFLEAAENPSPSIISYQKRNFKFGGNTKLLKILILEVARNRDDPGNMFPKVDGFQTLDVDIGV